MIQPLLRSFACFGLLAGLAGGSAAHGPTRQKVLEQISINAPADKRWATNRNFDALKDWHPAVAESPASKGDEEGSVRQLNLKSGAGLTETLEGHGATRMKYNYRAKDGGALPVTNYTSTLSVKADGAKAIFEWRGAFYRAYPNNDPPPDQNDEAAVAAVSGVYKSGLANLKAFVERK